MNGYKKVFLGMIFTTFHFNLGPIEILPAFIAILIICSGINEILVNYNNVSIKISLKLFEIKVLMSFITFALPFIGIENGFNNIIVNIIWFNVGSILEILSIVKLLEGTSEILSENYNTYLGNKYKSKAIVYIYFYSVVLIVSNINYIFMSESVGLVIAIYALIIKCMVIFSFRKLYNGDLKINNDFASGNDLDNI
ncbi:hypothetical protein ACQPVP_04525 [Clostridium nigeriense]|uniref:hypothetical protein n=1 Tax=Clostridium nigeriense TaxID=1805470 RepID=UPI003D348C8C